MTKQTKQNDIVSIILIYAGLIIILRGQKQALLLPAHMKSH